MPDIGAEGCVVGRVDNNSVPHRAVPKTQIDTAIRYPGF